MEHNERDVMSRWQCLQQDWEAHEASAAAVAAAAPARCSLRAGAPHCTHHTPVILVNQPASHARYISVLWPDPRDEGKQVMQERDGRWGRA